MDQRSEAWYKIKAGRISGSRFNALMKTTGGRPAIPARPAKETVRDESGAVIQRASKATPEKPAVPGKPTSFRANLIADLVWENVTGELTQIYQTYAMQRGIELEPDAILAYEDKLMVAVEPDGFIIHDDYDFVGVSPDGLIGDDGGGLIEVKCPYSEHKHLDALLNDSHAEEYKWQVQGQLWVTGRSYCDIVSFDPRAPKHLRLAICRVLPDLEMHKQLEDACIVCQDQVDAVLKQLQEKYPL